jgi:hypothetical protein
MFATLLSLVIVNAAPTIQPAKRPQIIIDPCSIGAADGSATLGADVDSRELFSSGIAYSTKSGCTRFVADFNVPSDANPASKYGVLEFDMGGGFASDPGQPSSCTGTVLSVTTYEKVAGATGFAKRTTATYKGKWSSGMFSSCSFVKSSGANPPTDTPNAAGAEVWRVAVSAKHNGVAKPVVARIAFKQVPW